MRRLGFTIIELLVVISIIAVLAGLLIVGVGKLQTTAKRRQTEQVLANCQAMFGDWEASTRITFSREPISAPWLVTTDSANISLNDATFGRYGYAELLTQDIMYHLKTTPTNAAAIAKMPANELMTWQPADYDFAAPSFTFNSSMPATWTNPASHAYSLDSANRYKDTASGTWYLSIQSSTAAPAPPDASYWLSEAPMTKLFGAGNRISQLIPLPLDAWGNPIIFVPYGLGQGQIAGQTPPSNDIPPIAPGGLLAAGGQYLTISSPDGRPFFASAGPDGNFGAGDDNLYSFDR